MTVSSKRAGLVLLVASSTLARSDHLLGQERRSPIGVLLTFVREDARKAVPAEMRPYDVGPIFLRVDPRVPGRDALGPLEQRNLERPGATLVDNRADALITGEGGAYVRDDGVYVVISSVDRVDHTNRPEGALAITFSYYVTHRRSGRMPVLCLQEWRIVQRPAGGAGWEFVEAYNFGMC